VTARAGRALRFHERTKHRVESVRSVRHWLDWDNRPNPFKEYRGLEALPPPHGLLRYDMPALEAPAEGSAQRRAAELGLPDLARHGQLWVKPKESLTAEKYDTFS
jgi:hypothetical protein